MFDARLLRVGVETRGKVAWFDNLAIEVQATKTSLAAANEATVKITNLAKATRDAILTETSPWNKTQTRKRLIVEAGRSSYGYTRVFAGDIMSATASQPPDITVTLTAKTDAWNKTQFASTSKGPLVQARSIAQGIADSLGLAALRWDVPDKQVSNWEHSGALSEQVNALARLGRWSVFVDDDTLVVAPLGKPLASVSPAVLDSTSGMVGLPEATEQGVKVRMMFSPNVRCGAALTLRSAINPSVNGSFVIFKMSYELSNRADPFYIVVEAYKGDRYAT